MLTVLIVFSEQKVQETVCYNGRSEVAFGRRVSWEMCHVSLYRDADMEDEAQPRKVITVDN
jgi:hypothetical protein